MADRRGAAAAHPPKGRLKAGPETLAGAPAGGSPVGAQAG